YNDPSPIQMYTLFPTRRSSDLLVMHGAFKGQPNRDRREMIKDANNILASGSYDPKKRCIYLTDKLMIELDRYKDRELEKSVRRRSEEHTSELQSRFDLVWRLLL